MTATEAHKINYDTLADIVQAERAERERLRYKLAKARHALRYIADNLKLDDNCRAVAEGALKESNYEPT